MSDGIKVRGRFTIRNHETGELLYEKDNLIVDSGLNFLADHVGNNAIPALGWLAIGTGVNAVLATDVALGAEVFRKAFTTESTPTNTYRAVTTILPSEALVVWKELGTFNASSGGVMFNRIAVDYDHPAAGVTIDVIYEVSFARA